jgi:hypothetical protein
MFTASKTISTTSNFSTNVTLTNASRRKHKRHVRAIQRPRGKRHRRLRRTRQRRERRYPNIPYRRRPHTLRHKRRRQLGRTPDKHERHDQARSHLKRNQRADEVEAVRDGRGGVADDEVGSARETFVEDFDDNTNVRVRVGRDDKRAVDFRYPYLDERVVQRREEERESVQKKRAGVPVARVSICLGCVWWVAGAYVLREKRRGIGSCTTGLSSWFDSRPVF